MISQSYWIFILVLATNNSPNVSNDVMMFDSKQACEKTRKKYVSVINGIYDLRARSYISTCYRGVDK